MFLSYDGIVFDMLFLDGWQVEADMSSDGVDFLRWHHIIDVTCVMNPAVTAANRFPRQKKFKDQLNKSAADEASSRLKSKSSNTKTGQVVGENKLKKPKRNTVAQGALAGLALLGGGTTVPLTTRQSSVPVSGSEVALLGGGTATAVLPSSTITSTPPLLSPPVLPLTINNQYAKWLRVLPSIPFVPPLGALIGPVFSTYADPFASNTPPAVFPGSTQGTANVSAPPSTAKGASRGSTEVIPNGNNDFQRAWEAAKLLRDAINKDIKAGIRGVLGAGLAGANAGLNAAISVGDELRKQFEFFSNALGISANDIFGGGRQPGEVSFPVPPVKRKINTPPPQAPGVSNNVGNTVPITFRELESRLANPRRELLVWLNTGPDGDNEYMVISPYPAMQVDAVSGPTCKMMHIPAIHGNVTGILKLRFETWIAPPPEVFSSKDSAGGWSKLKVNSGAGSSRLRTPATGNAVGQAPGGVFGRLIGKVVGNGADGNNILRGTPPIISNRWTMRQMPDPSTFLNTTVIEGVVHFRADVLQAQGLTADQLRMFFMHPIPFGYQRQPPEVVLNSDGTSVSYKIVDVQQMMNNPGGLNWGIAHIDVKQHFGYNSPIDYVRTPFSPFPSLAEAYPWVDKKLGRT